MPKIVNLRPNRRLINAKFEKYQYISETIPIVQDKTLPKNILQREPSSNEYSWLEIRLFSIHNYLFKNPFDSTFWFIDEDFNLWNLLKTDLQLVKTLRIPDLKPESGNYNPTLSFASKDIVIVSKGGDSLDILIRQSNQNNFELFSIENVQPGVLLDSFYSEEKSSILVAIQCIQNDKNNKKQSKVVLLNYIIKNEENSVEFQLNQVQNLIVNGPIMFLFINSDGNNVDILSQDTVKFTENPNANDSYNKNGNSDKVKKYFWSQDESFITMSVEIPEENMNTKPKIEITSTSLEITVKDFQVKGKFQFRISDEATTWNWNKNVLKVELMKEETGQMWMNLIDKDEDGEYEVNPDLAAEIHARLSHLCSDKPEDKNGGPSVGFSISEQLEECDLQGKENVLQKVNLTDNSTSHLVMLSPHNQLLFYEKLPSGFLMCVRNDHDGFVWNLPSHFSGDEWEIKHTNAFPGFGYIEAGKTNRKFSLSTPDGKYVMIIEHKRYGFVYEKPDHSGTIGKQRVIDLGSDALSIIGVGATNQFLFLLTKNKFYQLEI